MNQQDPLPGTHPHRGIFVSLVVAIILLIAVFGFFVYSAFFMTTEEPVVDDGKDALITKLENEVADLEKQLEDVEEIEQGLATFSSHPDTLPTFEYPAGWNISIRDESFEGDLFRYVHLSVDDLNFCEACDSVPSNIRILSSHADTVVGNHESFEAFVGATKDNEYNLDVEIKQVNENSYIVTGYWDALPIPGQYETLQYLAGSRLITVSRHGIEFTPEEDAGWELIKNSLDFSNIQ